MVLFVTPIPLSRVFSSCCVAPRIGRVSTSWLLEGPSANEWRKSGKVFHFFCIGWGNSPAKEISRNGESPDKAAPCDGRGSHGDIYQRLLVITNAIRIVRRQITPLVSEVSDQSQEVADTACPGSCIKIWWPSLRKIAGPEKGRNRIIRWRRKAHGDRRTAGFCIRRNRTPRERPCLVQFCRTMNTGTR